MTRETTTTSGTGALGADGTLTGDALVRAVRDAVTAVAEHRGPSAVCAVVFVHATREYRVTRNGVTMDIVADPDRAAAAFRAAVGLSPLFAPPR